MNKQLTLSEGSSFFDKLIQLVKTKSYSITQETMHQYMCSPIVFKLFTFVETFQMLYYVFHPQVHFEFTTILYVTVIQIIQYFSVNQIFVNSQGTLSIALVYVFFSIEVFIVILFVLVAFQYNKERKLSAILQYSMKILSFFGILQNTLAAMPFLNTYAVIIFCNSKSPYTLNNDCYNGIYNLHVFIAIFGFIIYVIITFFYGILFIDMNPNSQVPFASPQGKITLYRWVFKAIVAFYITIDYKGNYSKYYVVILPIVFLAQLIYRLISSTQAYNRSVYFFQVFMDCVLFYPSLILMFHVYLNLGNNVDDIGYFYLLCCTPLCGAVFIRFNEVKYQYLLKQNYRNIKSEVFAEQYIVLILHLIQNREHQNQRLLLEGVLVKHISICRMEKEKCPCKELIKDNLCEEDIQTQSNLWHSVVENILDLFLQKFHKSSRLKLLNAYIQKDCLNNRYKALYELMEIGQFDSTIQEEFSIYRCQYLINQDMQDEDIKFTEGKQIDVNNIIAFYNLFVELQNKLVISVSYHHEFWRELLEDSPDCAKLQKLGSELTSSVDEVNKIHKELLQINPNHIKCLIIYGQFQSMIINNDIEGPRILEKADQLSKSQMVSSQYGENDRNKYGENTCFIIVGCNKDNLGKINNCNREVIRLLEFQKQDLIGYDLGKIMPKVFADHHEILMRKYLKSSRSNIMGKERLVMAQNKSGYIIPCTIMVKMMPSLENGLEVTGFLKQMEFKDEDEPFYILYHPKTFQILGLSQNCNLKFGMPGKYVYGNSDNTIDYTLNCVFSDLAPLEDRQKDLENQVNQLFSLTIDTTKLNQTFLLDDVESNLHNEDPADYEQSPLIQSNQMSITQMNGQSQMLVSHKGKYRTQKVKCHILKQKYDEIDLYILKFTETDDNEIVKSIRNNEQQQKSEKKKAVQQKKMHKRHKFEIQDIDNEDRSSINSLNSVSSSLNDDMRALKDFKAMITEKTVPSQILYLQITLLCLSVLLFVIGAIDLYFKNIQNQQFTGSIYGLSQSYLRQSQLADLVFYTRMLQLKEQGIYNKTNGEDKADLFNKNITKLLTSLQDIQFNIIQNIINLSFLGYNLPTQPFQTISSMLQDGSSQNYTIRLDDALYQVINSGLGVSNFPNEYNSKYYYYITQNGLYVLRSAVEQASRSYQIAHQNLVIEKTYIFLVILILGIFFQIISLMILFPILTKVKQTNSKVLSLFGLIPLVEITELADKCEQYLKNFIEENQEKANNLISSRNINSVKIQVSQQKPEEQKQEEKKQQEDEVYFEVNNEDPDQQIIIPQNTDKDRKSKSQKSFKIDNQSVKPINNVLNFKNEKVQLIEPEKQKQLDKKQEEEKKQEQLQKQELEDLRVEKLQTSKSQGQTHILTRLGFFFGVFMSFFAIQFILEWLYIQNQILIYQHYELAFKRPTILRYTVYMAFEEIVQQKQLFYNSIEIKVDYHNRLYENERDLFNTIKSNFPNQFNTYTNLFQTMNYDNTCASLRLLSQVNKSQTQCDQVSQGILIKGLRTAVVSLALSTQDSISLQSGTLSEILNGDVFENLQQILGIMNPIFEALDQVYVDNYNNFVSTSQNLEELKFALFVLFWISSVLIMWIPYLRSMSRQIWRTKGMLNMIPLSIIQKYERLKDAFLHSNILQMVK